MSATTLFSDTLYCACGRELTLNRSAGKYKQIRQLLHQGLKPVDLAAKFPCDPNMAPGYSPPPPGRLLSRTKGITR